MSSDKFNVASYIREQSEELRKLATDSRLDLLTHIFGVAALEAAKHERDMLPPVMPRVDGVSAPDVNKDDDAQRRAALQEVLESFVNVAVDRTDGEARAAFYLADERGTSLHHVAGMSEAYSAYTNGFKIGAQSIACGLAAAIRRPVITPDVMRDSSWKDWHWLAEAFNYRGCWSFPIADPHGKVIGTFSMYFENPSRAKDRDIQFASMMTGAAAGIIEKRRELIA